MDQSHQDGWEIIVRTPRREVCRELHVVLEAVGFHHEMIHRDGQWHLIVPQDNADAAIAEIEAYQRDNAGEANTEDRRVPIFGGAFVGVVAYIGILVSIAVVSWSPESGALWMSAGDMDAGDVMRGQWWRTFTALTLHADLAHLLSNFVFGSVFGFMVGRILGGGVAWLTIVVSGALGNFFNALIREPEHSSIGASTAVFAALGMMVAHALRPRSAMPPKPMRRWSPLVGGVLMLAFTGLGGERTDVGAHVAGFIAGTMLGYLACRMPDRVLANARVQAVSGVVAATLVVVAWTIAIAK
ncbi:Rhomboid protease GluP [Planctomycetes bacterium CA13]|uniref:Rhomboid protease GluP n=1 Tax=Novipirellula herctigrandis TaxID=2527986 RepID=A0A5C5Z137_9BACT|nr:Rhomboid protease GluP [Planctomycetes bacterium CA13]